MKKMNMDRTVGRMAEERRSDQNQRWGSSGSTKLEDKANNRRIQGVMNGI